MAKVQQRVQRERRPLRGEDDIGVAVGKALGASKVAKHFRYEITHDGFTLERDEEKIEAEAALDGIYVIRTNRLQGARKVLLNGRVKLARKKARDGGWYPQTDT